MAIQISCAPTSCDFSSVPVSGSVVRNFVVSVKDTAILEKRGVRIRVEAISGTLTRFLVRTSAGWMPGSGEVPAATSPVVNYGPGLTTGTLNVTVVCRGAQPEGLALGRLVVTVLPNGPSREVQLTATVQAVA